MGDQANPSVRRVYAVVLSRDAMQLMAGWPDEIRSSMQRRLEQLAELPLGPEAGAVRSVVQEGARGEFRLQVELQPQEVRLLVTPV